ncbi:MAG: hypothetical protein V4753_09940 [Pseudomonadota bacterium]
MDPTMCRRFQGLSKRCGAALFGVCIVLQTELGVAQQTPLTIEQKYCVGMGGVAGGFMDMARAGRSGTEIKNELARTVRQAGWPLGVNDFNLAVDLGVEGLRGGDDSRAVAALIIRECLNYAWYSR